MQGRYGSDYISVRKLHEHHFLGDVARNGKLFAPDASGGVPASTSTVPAPGMVTGCSGFEHPTVLVPFICALHLPRSPIITQENGQHMSNNTANAPLTTECDHVHSTLHHFRFKEYPVYKTFAL